MDNFIIYPALLFPAIPLMMTNFTHRYNSCAALVRKIHAEIIEKKIDTKDVMGRRYIAQIKTLTYRIKLIKLIQTLSGLALFTNLLTIFFGYIEGTKYFVKLFWNSRWAIWRCNNSFYNRSSNVGKSTRISFN